MLLAILYLQVSLQLHGIILHKLMSDSVTRATIKEVVNISSASMDKSYDGCMTAFINKRKNGATSHNNFRYVAV